MFYNKSQRQSEKGNVLFLILIAVALFAALSYVVTQSTRSGSGSTESEKNLLSSAQMTQYPTALRTAVIRMILGGTGVEQVHFDVPGSAFFTGTASTNLLVFHPNGGGASYQQAPADLSATGQNSLSWYFNGNFYVPGIGTDGTSGGNDIIAFLPGVSAGVCRKVNEELGIDPTSSTNSANCSTQTTQYLPVMDSGIDIDNDVKVSMNDGYDFDAAMGSAIALETVDGATCTVLNRQASGCFSDGASPASYTFYSVLLER
ncbi:MAG: hypothetical protein DI551_03175 [Micavibrio aeruginosavorus]|uniref:Uncharacterized protein n=1 Tax=Micavibrio aeruginosavorus TaxID=349221 RepID=A0A2W5N1W5_9BACT|nr:MAG: hypothetical protein DI551_03175 [Micavibrio aeruginosavorus]